MVDGQKIDMVRVLTGCTDDDDVLFTYLDLAGSKIVARAYPYDHSCMEVPEEYHILQCEIAAYLLNKRGAEGQLTHTENGITRTYENGDIPSSMLRTVIPHCGTIK